MENAITEALAQLSADDESIRLRFRSRSAEDMPTGLFTS